MITRITDSVFIELEAIAYRIENNTASLVDYKRYESLLLQVGLPRDFIFSYLQKAGFNSWEKLIKARTLKEQMRRENLKAMAVGAIVGIGLGVLLAKSQQ